MGYDVAFTNPNASSTLQALRALDLVIIQDLFMTETAREVGTVFLPACSSFEKDGTFMNAERRIQRVRAALPPAGESLPDWQAIALVARAMGCGEQFSFGGVERIWNEIRGVWPAGRGITYGRLNEGGLQWPCPDETHPGTQLLHATGFADGPRASLRLIEHEPSPEHTDAQFPLVLITGRVLYAFNAGTMTGCTPNAELRAQDVLDISAQDAARLGVRSGDLVTVTSRYGSADLPAAVSHAVRAGEVFATFSTPALCVNRVTGPHRDPITHTPEYKLTAVRVEAARRSTPR
jgi:formate dehydrogenase major subunit